MNRRATRFPTLSALALVVAVSGLSGQDQNPGQRRMDLPARKGPHAISGHDRPDLRRDWNLFWFGGQPGPDYLDFKNRQAAVEVQRWRHLLPSGTAGKLLPSATSTLQPLSPGAFLPAAGAGSGPAWTNLGPTAEPTTASYPDIDSGRPVAIAPHPTASTLYLATSGGGVFRCDNADLASTADWTWTAVTDNLPTSGASGNVAVGAFALSPADPSVLYVGAGDMQDATGRGFYKSTDGGTTWTAATGIGLATRSYAILPLSASLVLWGTDDGLKVSTNGGASFSAAAGGPATGKARSLQKLSATDLVCTLQDATSGTGTIYYSSTGGTSWTAATITGVTFPIGRITVSAGGDGTTAYAMLENTTNSSSSVVAPGVLKSTDKGHTWTWVAPATAPFTTYAGNPNSKNDTGDGGQGWYNHMITVDPSNPSRLFLASNLAAWRSTDGGVNWTQLTHWYGYGHVYAHADFHAAAWSANGSTLYLANDGGLCIVRDPFRSPVPTGTSYVASDVTFIDNRRNKGLTSHLAYNVGSTTAATPSDSKWRISLGLQDLGTRLRQPATAGALLTGTEGVFQDMIGGDGFATLFHPADGTQVLGSVYYSDIYKSTNGGSKFTESISGITEANDKNFAPFASQLAPGDTAHPATVYTHTNGKVYQSLDFGSTWTALGTTNLPAPLDASSTTTSSPTPLYIRNMAAAPGDPNTLGLAANASRVYLTTNGGTSWTAFPGLPGSDGYLSCIAFDPLYATTVYVGSVAPSATANHLWKSANGGATWAALDGSAATSNGFPFGIPVYVVKVHPQNSQVLYAGTDFGVYASTNGGSSWSRFGSNLPLVAVRDIYVAPDGSFLRAATFGRGVWEVPTSAAAVTVSLDKGSVTLSPSGTTTFTATVANFASDNKVNWSAPSGGGTLNPTQTASGSATTYTAPATIGIYTVTAASNEVSTATATATVNVYDPAQVTTTVSPATATVIAGGTFTFTATVTGAPTQGVTWSASGGSITSAGVYTAPASAGTYTVTATSTWPGTTPGTATVTVRTLDLNGDGVVDLRDLLFFARYYGTANAACDLNGDGLVDDKDLALLLAGL